MVISRLMLFQRTFIIIRFVVVGIIAVCKPISSILYITSMIRFNFS